MQMNWVCNGVCQAQTIEFHYRLKHLSWYEGLWCQTINSGGGGGGTFTICIGCAKVKKEKV